jgi:uncharacterized protein YjbI with pentapeptide repeats
MANQQHVDILRDGVQVWNLWRREEPAIRPDLSRAGLSGAILAGAYLYEVDLGGADLRQAYLRRANLMGAYLDGAYLSRADLSGADLSGADFSGADLREAHLLGAHLSRADLSGADLRGAHLSGTDLSGAYLNAANLRGADLSAATCLRTTFAGATLTGCTVCGISAWDVNLDDAKQADLRITPLDEETHIAVDNLEVAQFLYLLLRNEKIRAVIDTLTSKVVLILGRFIPERKAVLDALREALRELGYVAVLFDCAGPESKDTTETVTLLARMARFVVADLTDPGRVPYELAKIVPDAQVPVQPLLLAGTTTFAMAGDLWRAREMLPVVYYTTPEALLAILLERVIAPAEEKVAEIQRERATSLLLGRLSHPPLQGS